MIFMTIECRGCGKKTFIDGADETHHCMACGVALDATEAQPIGDFLSHLLTEVLEQGYVARDFSGEAWYPRVREALTLLEDGRAEEAAGELARLLDEDPALSEDVRVCVQDELSTWMVSLVGEGEPYTGGLADIARVVEEYGEETGPNVMVSAFFYAVASSPMVRSPYDAAVVSETLFWLLTDYCEVEPDIRAQLGMCTEFLGIAADNIDAADSMAEQVKEQDLEDIRDWIYILQDFVEILGNAIFETCDPVRDRLEELADGWRESDISTIGAEVRAVAEGYLDDAISDEDAAARLRDYVSAYIGQP